MYDQRLYEEMYDGFGNKENWKKIPLIFVATAIAILLWLYWDAHSAPYQVRLNPETDYGGFVYLYSNMNPVSSPYEEIPVDTICDRVDNEVYTQDFDTPLEFYKLRCRNSIGYARTNKVILP